MHITKLCMVAEKSLRHTVKSQGLPTTALKQVATQTLTYILLNSLNQPFTCLSHSSALIRDIVTRYITIRIKYELTKVVSQENMRQKLNRLVIFSHI